MKKKIAQLLFLSLVCTQMPITASEAIQQSKLQNLKAFLGSKMQCLLKGAGCSNFEKNTLRIVSALAAIGIVIGVPMLITYLSKRQKKDSFDSDKEKFPSIGSEDLEEKITDDNEEIFENEAIVDNLFTITDLNCLPSLSKKRISLITTADHDIHCLLNEKRNIAYVGKITALPHLNKYKNVKHIELPNSILLYRPEGKRNALLFAKANKNFIGEMYGTGRLLGYPEEDIKYYYITYPTNDHFINWWQEKFYLSNAQDWILKNKSDFVNWTQQQKNAFSEYEKTVWPNTENGKKFLRDKKATIDFIRANQDIEKLEKEVKKLYPDQQ